MSKRETFIRATVGAATLIAATSILAGAYAAGPANDFRVQMSSTLPGAAAAIEPCSVAKTKSPLGY